MTFRSFVNIKNYKIALYEERVELCTLGMAMSQGSHTFVLKLIEQAPLKWKGGVETLTVETIPADYLGKLLDRDKPQRIVYSER